MAFTPAAGKYGRILQNSSAVEGSFRWQMSMKRDRLDVTNFESTLSADGYNVFSDGLTGILDTTATIEGYVNGSALTIFMPKGQLAYSFLYTKTPVHGFLGVNCDILEFAPGIQVRDRQQFTAQLQSNGSVADPS